MQAPAEPEPRRQEPRWLAPAICGALAVLTFAVFSPTLHHQFVNYDDDLYVYDNPVVARGLTWQGVAWAFGIHVVNWHPLTWLSHMLDCQLYGLHPWGHHLTNILLHTATVVCLFLVLREMTGALWRGAFVAAVFAVHPLRVESVAWVAERKDVLSGLFLVLTIWAYARYARHPGSPWRYSLVLLLFALGLMSKPMLVTLPLLLLLLDYWPLGREGNVRRLMLEKLPLLALSVAVCAITYLAQSKAVHSGGVFTLQARLANAVVSGVIYLRQMFWPSGLAVLYPFPASLTPVWQWAGAFLLLAALSILAWMQRRTRPWLLAGWLWHWLMLLPVLGLIQVGRQAHADRYTYLPQIGLIIALTWLLAELLAGRAALGSLMAAAIAALAVCACRQEAFWQDSETLWQRALACTRDNELAHTNLGAFYAKQGRSAEAIAQYREALRLNPDSPTANSDLAAQLLAQGKVDEAIALCRRALKARPDFAPAHFNLGDAFRQSNRIDDAISQYEESVRLDPSAADTQNILGMLLRQRGRVDEALVHYRAALALRPDNESLHVNVANALLQKGSLADALVEYRRALEIQPSDMEVQNNLAWQLATSPDASLRNGTEALRLARQADELAAGKNPVVLGTLAAALAETGQYAEAAASAGRAVALAEAARETELARRLREQEALYRSGRPYHRP